MAKEKVNTSKLAEFVTEYRSKIADSAGAVDIVTFAEAQWGLRFQLFPMQRLILKCFYGMPLDDSERTIPIRDELNNDTGLLFTEKEAMDWLISQRRVNLKEYIPGKTRRKLMLCCGRRASKSNIISLICAYEAYRMIKLGNPQEYYGFPSGQEIDITTIASVDEQANTLFNMIRNRVQDCPFFNGRVESDTQSYFSIRTDDDVKANRAASVRIYCCGAGSSALRSKNNLVVVMDEAAHFPLYGKCSMDNIWGVLTPSASSFAPKGSAEGEGKIIMLSSPLAKSGRFWTEYCDSFDYPDEILMFQMYSALINLKIDGRFLQSEQRHNPDLFRCEYGGEFSDTVTSWCDPKVLEQAAGSVRRENRLKGEKGVAYYMGIDYGGKNDGTSIAICHREDETIVLDYADVYYAKGSDVWDSMVPYYREVNRSFAEEPIIPLAGIADEVKAVCSRFPVVEGWFDQFNGYGLLELLKERGLNQFTLKNVSQSLNLQVYQTAKSLLHSGLLRLFDHPVLLPELKSLEERKNGNAVTVEAPQRGGFHDDISDAFARAVYAAYNAKRSAVRHCTIGLQGKRGGGGTSQGTFQSFQMKRLKAHGGEFANLR